MRVLGTRAAATAIPGTAKKVHSVGKRNFNPEDLRLAKLFHESSFRSRTSTGCWRHS
jgi:hypothetical protein